MVRAWCSPFAIDFQIQIHDEQPNVVNSFRIFIFFFRFVCLYGFATFLLPFLLSLPIHTSVAFVFSSGSVRAFVKHFVESVCCVNPLSGWHALGTALSIWNGILWTHASLSGSSTLYGLCNVILIGNWQQCVYFTLIKKSSSIFDWLLWYCAPVNGMTCNVHGWRYKSPMSLMKNDCSHCAENYWRFLILIEILSIMKLNRSRKTIEKHISQDFSVIKPSIWVIRRKSRWWEIHRRSQSICLIVSE